jgi:hypothetical protein
MFECVGNTSATTAAVVSELVAKGYAHLTGFDQVSTAEDAPGRASFAFFPDPACARIAMCLIDDKYVFQWKGKKSPTDLDLQFGTRKICGTVVLKNVRQNFFVRSLST